MTYALRDYQQRAVEVGLENLRNLGRPFVIQAATGAGKSLIIADVCHKLNEPVLILQPSKELLEQNYAKLLSYDPMIDAGVYSASKGRKEIRTFTYATIGSIYKQPENFKHFKYVIVDECDVVNPKEIGMYQQFFKGINCHSIMGLTATPYRIDALYRMENGYLRAKAALKMITRIGKPTFWSGGIAYKIETQELIDRKYLSPIKYHVDSDDLHQLVVNTTGADFTKDSLEKWAASKVNRMADYVEWADDKCQRNLVFCTSVAQTYKLQEILAARGIEAGIVSAETPAQEREQLVNDFRAGKIKHMLNVGVFLAGFDVPELNLIIFARPTLSPRVWYQAVGRGVRLDPSGEKKTLHVIDMAGAVKRIGKVETIRLGKDADGFRDALHSEVGRLDDRTLYSFRIERKKKEVKT